MSRTAAVVGCGVGGMAAALALARRGWEVTVLEAFAEPRPLGSGLLLQPTGLKALDLLGLGEAVWAKGAPIERLFGRTAQGRRVIDMRYADWRAGAQGLGVHRSSLFGALHVALAPAGVTLKTGVEVVAVADSARPRLRDAAGAEHGPFDLAVIADGSASRLRGVLNPRARAPVYPWGAVWGNASDPEGRFSGVLAQVYDRAEVMIGALPIGLGPDPAQGPLVSLFWSLPVARQDAFFAERLEDWRTRIGAYWPEVRPLFDQLDHAGLSRAVYRDVSAGRWNHGACTLLGDAAHGTSPQLGQGANLALIDAVELAERLAEPRPVPVSLGRFQAERRRHTTLYQLLSRALTPLYQSSGRFWSAVRDWVYAPVSMWPGVRRLGAHFLVGAVRLGRWPADLKP